MQWEDREESQNVEDRRRMSPKAGLALGGGGLLVVFIALLFGLDPRQVANLIGGAGGGGQDQGQIDPSIQFTPQQERMASFSKVIFGDTERIWSDLFAREGKEYKKPILVLFTNRVNSACGNATSSVGPFYCPGDHKVYLDLTFFRDLRERFRAPGDFAQAYVIAHEVGHHVQALLGTSDRVQAARQRGSEREANALSVRLELQADCFAGVWAFHADKARQILEQGDVEEALNAASAIGDDRLQKRSQGHVTPDSFTHGSSAQRVEWFQRGLKSGRMDQCDTFAAGRRS